MELASHSHGACNPSALETCGDYMEVSQIWEYPFERPYTKDSGIGGSILAYLQKLPYMAI